MIKTLVKHFIYEKAIDVFFQNVYKNLLSPQLKIALIEYGDVQYFIGAEIENLLMEQLLIEVRHEVDMEVLNKMRDISNTPNFYDIPDPFISRII